MNICMCGALAGYPHADDCPYPLFRGSQSMENAWEAARHEKQNRLIVSDLVSAAAEAVEVFGEDELERFAAEYQKRRGG